MMLYEVDWTLYSSSIIYSMVINIRYFHGKFHFHRICSFNQNNQVHKTYIVCANSSHIKIKWKFLWNIELNCNMYTSLSMTMTMHRILAFEYLYAIHFCTMVMFSFPKPIPTIHAHWMRSITMAIAMFETMDRYLHRKIKCDSFIETCMEITVHRLSIVISLVVDRIQCAWVAQSLRFLIYFYRRYNGTIGNNRVT